MHIGRLLFLHANGYPAAVYRRFLEPLSKSFDVVPVAVLESAAAPAALRWRRMHDQVMEHLAAAVKAPDSAGSATGLLGHSMGGYLALTAAAHRLPSRHPVVLIDSPLPAPGKAALLSLAQRTGLARRLGPAPVAARRRDNWPDLDQARGFFAAKAFVQRWAPGVLDDFLAHALTAAADAGALPGLTLRIPRAEESDVYAHLPHREAAQALRRLRAAGVPVGFVAGRQSAEMRMAGWQANRRLFGNRLLTLEGGHLVPLEAPERCAEAVISLFRTPAERTAPL